MNRESWIAIAGVALGGFLAAGPTIYMFWQNHEWDKQSLFSMLQAEVATIIQYQNTEYLRSLSSELQNKRVWQPIDLPRKRKFAIFDANVGHLGLLGKCLSGKVVHFYALADLAERNEQMFSDGRFLKLAPPDQLIWLRGYIELNERIKNSGTEISEMNLKSACK